MEQKLIGKRIQLAREQAGLSQDQLAERLGLSCVFISMIERGVRAPRLEVFVHIVNELGVSADILLQDVLEQGYKTSASLLSERLETLPPAERSKVLAVVAAMINT